MTGIHDKESVTEILESLEYLKKPIEDYEKGLNEFKEAIKNYEKKIQAIHAMNQNHKPDEAAQPKK